ncbi:MAG: hypothetical protein HKP09_02415 [Enterobacterales bacterium]|nr:hypothetical protein [Enterobacterales bacterium]
MKRLTVISKIKILGIGNKWQKLLISTLSHKSSLSGKREKIFDEILENHIPEDEQPNARRQFNAALKAMLNWSFVYEKDKQSGPHLYLDQTIWLQQDALLQSISVATLQLAKNRRPDIGLDTILREVRKKLRHYEVEAAYKTSKILVPYVLYKQCRWRFDAELNLRPPATTKRKKIEAFEEQQELFSF